MFTKLTRGVGVAIIATFASITLASAQGFKPENPECIAPANAGGGWDFICRNSAKFLHDLGLIDGTMQVTNMAGGGGGVAYAHVSKERNDDNNLIVAASNATTARLSQGAYPDSTADDVRFLATFGAEYGTIAVAKDSDIKDLKDLMNRVVADPRSIAWSGGSSVGGYDHIKPLLLANAAGLTDVTKLKYVAFDGGGEAMTALLSNSVQVLSSDFSEIRGFAESGDVRILAVLSPNRLTGYGQYPTAKEQGYDVIGANWRGMYMPRGASDEAYEFWTNAIRKMTEDEGFRQSLLGAGIEPFNNFGADMDAFITKNISEITKISKEIGIIK